MLPKNIVLSAQHENRTLHSQKQPLGVLVPDRAVDQHPALPSADMVESLSLPELQVVSNPHLPKVIPRLLKMRSVGCWLVEGDQIDLSHPLPFLVTDCGCADLANAMY